jgi:hypothetical protein
MVRRETSPPVLGSSPIGGVELGKRNSSSRKRKSSHWKLKNTDF